MKTSFSRKRLIVDLLRRGVAPAYAWRVTGELADHADDLAESRLEPSRLGPSGLTQNGLGTRAGLGDVDVLAAQIVENYRNRTFAGRHPILTFAVAPFPLILAAIVGFWTAGGLLVYAGTQLTHYAGLAALFVHTLGMLVPAMLVTWLFCRLGRGAGLPWRKVACACLPIFAVAFLFNSWLKLTDLDPETHGALMFGLNLPLAALFGPAFGKPSWALPMVWTPLGRLALPLCVVVWMCLRERALVRETLSRSDENADGETHLDPRLHEGREAA